MLDAECWVPTRSEKRQCFQRTFLYSRSVTILALEIISLRKIWYYGIIFWNFKLGKEAWKLNHTSFSDFGSLIVTKVYKKLSFRFQVEYGTLRTVISMMWPAKEKLNGMKSSNHQTSVITHREATSRGWNRILRGGGPKTTDLIKNPGIKTITFCVPFPHTGLPSTADPPVLNTQCLFNRQTWSCSIFAIQRISPTSFSANSFIFHMFIVLLQRR